MHFRTPSMIVFFMFVATVCSGCRIFTPPADSTEVDGTTWLDYDATRRGGFVMQRTASDGKPSQPFILAESAPDVAASISAELVAKTKGVEISGKLTESLLELGKRTETVMILRESMYRLAELSSNLSLSADQASALYERVLTAVTVLSLAEHASSQADIAQAIADVVRATHGASQSPTPPPTKPASPPASAVSARPAMVPLKTNVYTLQDTVHSYGSKPLTKTGRDFALERADELKVQIAALEPAQLTTLHKDRVLSDLEAFRVQIDQAPVGKLLPNPQDLADAVGQVGAELDKADVRDQESRGSTSQSDEAIRNLQKMLDSQQALVNKLLEAPSKTGHK